MSTGAITTQPMTTSPLTTLAITSMAVTSADLTTQDMTTQDMTTQDMTTQDVTTVSVSTSSITSGNIPTMQENVTVVTMDVTYSNDSTVFNSTDFEESVCAILSETVGDECSITIVAVARSEKRDVLFQVIFYFVNDELGLSASTLLQLVNESSSQLLNADFSITSIQSEIQTVNVPIVTTGTTGEIVTTGTTGSTVVSGETQITTVSTSTSTGAKEEASSSGLSKNEIIIIAVVVPGGFIIMTAIVISVLYYRKKNALNDEEKHFVEMTVTKTKKADTKKTSSKRF